MLKEREASATEDGFSREASVEPPPWSRQREEASDEDESEQPEQRLLLNVPIRARHSSTDIMTTTVDCR